VHKGPPLRVQQHLGRLLQAELGLSEQSIGISLASRFCPNYLPVHLGIFPVDSSANVLACFLYMFRGSDYWRGDRFSVCPQYPG
jgi:hypothetical protein